MVPAVSVDPVSTADFAQVMMRLGPFEERPHLAVAVSGGVDSLALAALTADWVAGKAGRLSVLSVDHGLRPEAAAECRRVAELTRQLGRQAGLAAIDHHILVWDGAKPATGLMQAAREARYRLLADWCRAQGVLHLAVAHHADDLAETYLMRQAHGSTDYGLAAMPAVRPLDGVRLLRPLLAVSKARLIASARARNLSWIEDPSNRASRFERVRWRERPSAAQDAPVLLAAAVEAGVRRDGNERSAAAWLGRHARIAGAGYVQLDRRAMTEMPQETAFQVLRDLLRLIGPDPFTSAPALLATAYGRLIASARGSFTLGGCILDWRGGLLRLYREAAACAGPLPIEPGEACHWDGRYRVELDVPRVAVNDLGLNDVLGGSSAPANLTVAALGEWGLANRPVPPHLADVPLRARQALPGLWRGRDLVGWPRIIWPLIARSGSGYDLRQGSDCGQPEIGQRIVPGQDVAGENSHGPYTLNVAFLPNWPATSCGFTVVIPAKHTM